MAVGVAVLTSSVQKEMCEQVKSIGMQMVAGNDVVIPPSNIEHEISQAMAAI